VANLWANHVVFVCLMWLCVSMTNVLKVLLCLVDMFAKCGCMVEGAKGRFIAKLCEFLELLNAHGSEIMHNMFGIKEVCSSLDLLQVVHFLSSFSSDVFIYLFIFLSQSLAFRLLVLVLVSCPLSLNAPSLLLFYFFTFVHLFCRLCSFLVFLILSLIFVLSVGVVLILVFF